jgi:hypothetical protein
LPEKAFCRRQNVLARDWKGLRNMPKYFFVVRHRDETSDHSDGIEFPDLGAVQIEAIKSTGEILRDFDYPNRSRFGWLMEVVDEAGKPLFSLAL